VVLDQWMRPMAPVSAPAPQVAPSPPAEPATPAPKQR